MNKIFLIILVLISFMALFLPFTSAASDFIGVPTSGQVPLTVQFTDGSTNNPTSWAWYFGDENYTGPWSQVTANANFSARQGQSSVVMPDGSIVLMGGRHFQTFYNDVWRSTDYGETWRLMTASANWSARYGQSSVVMPDGSIILMGGANGTYTDGFYEKNDVWRSVDYGANWTQVNTLTIWPQRREPSSVVTPDGSILLMGGWTGTYNGYSDVWRSTDYGITWRQIYTFSSSLLGQSSCVMPDGSIILLTLINGWRSTDNGDNWTEIDLGSNGVQCSGSPMVVMPDGTIIVAGGSIYWGFGTAILHEVWKGTNNGSTWTRLPDLSFARGGSSGIAMPDGSIILIGGFDVWGDPASNVYLYNDVWRLNTRGSSAQNPSHTYTTPGIYPVGLQAYNAGGYNSTQRTAYIAVTALTAPVASFTANQTIGNTPITIQLNDTSTGGAPTSWNWSFGDGTWFNTTDPLLRNGTKTYTSAGSYNVRLLVSNTAGENMTIPGTNIVASSMNIYSISPNICNNTVSLPVTITGANFTTTDTVVLTNTSFSIPGSITFQNNTTIKCTFPLSGALTRIFQLKIKKTDGNFNIMKNALHHHQRNSGHLLHHPGQRV